MEVNRFRQFAQDVQLIFWDLPIWIIDDFIWQYKVRYKRHDWEDYE